MASDFTTRVRDIKSIHRSRITTPRFSVSDWSKVLSSLHTERRQGATGGVGQMLSPMGSYLRSTPQTGAANDISIGVVRDTGTGEEHFILVNRLTPSTDTDPWDGSWEIEETEAQPVSCEPGLLSKDYQLLIWRMETMERNTPVVFITQINGVHIAWRTWKFRNSPLGRNPLLQLTECTSISQGG